MIAVIVLGLLQTDASSEPRPSPAIGPAELYFLAIGSEEYAGAGGQGRDRSGFAPTGLAKGAEYSARRVASALLAAGAKYGILLTSQSETPNFHAVSREDIVDAILALKKQVRDDGPEAPRILFYYAGHGLGDEINRFLYLLPGDIAFSERPTQSRAIHLLQETIWDFDIVMSLVMFRMHWSMSYLDDFFPTQVMADFMDFSSVLRASQRQNELQRIDDRQRRSGIYPPEGNPPVPFIVLFDNCYGGVAEDMISRFRDLSGMFSIYMDGVRGEVTTDGAVVYATKPGRPISPVLVPSTLVEANDNGGIQFLGVLAIQLLSVLNDYNGKGGIRLDTLFQALISPVPNLVADPNFSDWGAFTANTRLESDVQEVEFIPPVVGDSPGELEPRYGTGKRIRICCE